jgi:spermidine synthase
MADRRNPVPSYRVVIYVGTFVSGAVALLFQVVWQRYLSFLVGCEARSVSLVVAVFLLGLAAGYRFWGDLTRRGWSRAALLKTVGFVELGIAAYGLAFGEYFALVKTLAYGGPDWLAFDLLLTGLLLLPPTFLMGASIPLLTAAVPLDPDEVNYCHTRVYGINTLGAVVGALAGGLWLVPGLGLVGCLIVGSMLGAAVGLVFVFNPLAGPSHKAADIPSIANRYGRGGIYLFVFITGAVSIALEVLLVRVVALTIGASQYVFPIVVGVVILGLAVGSLSLRRTTLTARRVPHELIKVAAILAVLYLTMPYWPSWVSHVRVSLATIPSNFPVYLILVVVLVAAALLPLVVPMGRLLPLGYVLLEKGREDYGRMCGRVYFCNTLGTAAGAVGIGYLLLLVLSLPVILKLNMALLLVLAAFLSARSARRPLAVWCLAGAAAAFLLPPWNRAAHVIGLFRQQSVQEWHFQGPFHLPSSRDDLDLLLLRDDPSTTVAVYAKPVDPFVCATATAKTITVNGKSDGNTIADYSTVALLAMVPYLYSPRQSGLKVAVVGLGTGITSGALASMPDVESVTTLEISPGVIEAARFFDDCSFELSRNPKSRIVQTDAFRFFARTEEKFDLIVSEPSNPWVVGVENLFTPEFYALAAGALTDGGLLFQWIQLYATTEEIVGAICANVSGALPHRSLFLLGKGDVGVLAGRAPLAGPHLERRLGQPAAQRVLAPVGIDEAALLSILEVWQGAQMRAVQLGANPRGHNVEHPWISHAAAKALFLDQGYGIEAQVLADFGRHLPVTDRRRADFEAWMGRHAAAMPPWCGRMPGRHSTGFLCTRLQVLAADYQRVRAPTEADDAAARLASYGHLREQGYAAADLQWLEAIGRTLLERAAGTSEQAAAVLLVKELALEWEWERAGRALDELAGAGVIAAPAGHELRREIEEYREAVGEWAVLVSP